LKTLAGKFYLVVRCTMLMNIYIGPPSESERPKRLKIGNKYNQ
jgi:hypothetical protein